VGAYWGVNKTGIFPDFDNEHWNKGERERVGAFIVWSGI
jgi:hypothetical protein